MKDLLDKLANLPGSIKAGLAGAVVVLAFALIAFLLAPRPSDQPERIPVSEPTDSP